MVCVRKPERIYTPRIDLAMPGDVIQLGYADYYVLSVSESASGKGVWLKIKRLPSQKWDTGRPFRILVVKRDKWATS